MRLQRARVQGGTVDNLIVVMEAGWQELNAEKRFYLEISWAKHRAKMVTDKRQGLGDRLEAAAGGRVSSLVEFRVRKK